MKIISVVILSILSLFLRVEQTKGNSLFGPCSEKKNITIIIDYENKGKNERFFNRYLTELAHIQDCYTINIYLTDEDRPFRWDGSAMDQTRISSYLPNNLKEALVIKTQQTNTFLDRLITSGPAGDEQVQQVILYMFSGYNAITLSNLRILQERRHWYIILKCTLEYCPRPEWLPIRNLITQGRFHYEQMYINIKDLLMSPDFDRFQYAKSLQMFDWSCLENISTIYFRMDSINGIYFPMILKIIDVENRRRNLNDSSVDRLRLAVYDSPYTDRDEMNFWSWYVMRLQTKDLTLATYEEVLQQFRTNSKSNKGIRNAYFYVAENIHQRDGACWFSEWDFIKRHKVYQAKHIPIKSFGRKKRTDDTNEEFKDCEDKEIAKQFQYPEELFGMISQDVCNL